MGRPLNKKYFGTGANTIPVEAWIPGGAGVVTATIISEDASGEYTVTDGTNTGRVRLQEATPAAAGEARIAVTPDDGVVNVGATATAVITAGDVTGVAALVGGSGYSVAPTVTIAGDGTTAPTATATIAGGVVTGITVNPDGTADFTVATVTISAPAAGGLAEAAKQIHSHKVKTWEGNTYKWGVGVIGAGTATILTP